MNNDALCRIDNPAPHFAALLDVAAAQYTPSNVFDSDWLYPSSPGGLWDDVRGPPASGQRVRNNTLVLMQQSVFQTSLAMSRTGHPSWARQLRSHAAEFDDSVNRAVDLPPLLPPPGAVLVGARGRGWCVLRDESHADELCRVAFVARAALGRRELGTGHDRTGVVRDSDFRERIERVEPSGACVDVVAHVPAEVYDALQFEPAAMAEPEQPALNAASVLIEPLARAELRVYVGVRDGARRTLTLAANDAEARRAFAPDTPVHEVVNFATGPRPAVQLEAIQRYDAVRCGTRSLAQTNGRVDKVFEYDPLKPWTAPAAPRADEAVVLLVCTVCSDGVLRAVTGEGTDADSWQGSESLHVGEQGDQLAQDSRKLRDPMQEQPGEQQDDRGDRDTDEPEQHSEASEARQEGAGDRSLPGDTDAVENEWLDGGFAIGNLADAATETAAAVIVLSDSDSDDDVDKYGGAEDHGTDDIVGSGDADGVGADADDAAVASAQLTDEARDKLGLCEALATAGPPVVRVDLLEKALVSYFDATDGAADDKQAEVTANAVGSKRKIGGSAGVKLQRRFQASAAALAERVVQLAVADGLLHRTVDGVSVSVAESAPVRDVQVAFRHAECMRDVLMAELRACVQSNDHVSLDVLVPALSWQLDQVNRPYDVYEQLASVLEEPMVRAAVPIDKQRMLHFEFASSSDFVQHSAVVRARVLTRLAVAMQTGDDIVLSELDAALRYYGRTERTLQSICGTSDQHVELYLLYADAMLKKAHLEESTESGNDIEWFNRAWEMADRARHAGKPVRRSTANLLMAQAMIGLGKFLDALDELHRMLDHLVEPVVPATQNDLCSAVLSTMFESTTKLVEQARQRLPGAPDPVRVVRAAMRANERVCAVQLLLGHVADDDRIAVQTQRRLIVEFAAETSEQDA